MYLPANSRRYHNADDIGLREPKPELYREIAELHGKHTPKELARAYGISLRTVWRAIASKGQHK